MTKRRAGLLLPLPLLLFAVLLGLLAMHGPAAPPSTGVQAAAQAPAAVAEHAGHRAGPAATLSGHESAARGEHSEPDDHSHGAGGLLHLCVAILTAGLLLAVTILGLRWRPTGLPSPRPVAPSSLARLSLPPPFGRQRLIRLSVSLT